MSKRKTLEIKPTDVGFEVIEQAANFFYNLYCKMRDEKYKLVDFHESRSPVMLSFEEITELCGRLSSLRKDKPKEEPPKKESNNSMLGGKLELIGFSDDHVEKMKKALSERLGKEFNV